MSILSISLAFGATLLARSASAQPQPLEARQPTGTYTFYDQDIYIDGVQIYQELGSSDTVFNVRVYGGRILVGTDTHDVPAIDASGAPGRDGGPASVAFFPWSYPSNASPPGPAFSVKLETYPLAGVSSTLDIVIARDITVAGGAGGYGHTGTDEFSLGPGQRCAHYSATPGSSASAGGDAGSITLMSSGNILLSAGLLATGGRGGDGATGGRGGRFAANVASPGADGGRGGTISISHTAAAPPTATFEFLADLGEPVGSLQTDGGSGGRGGNGNAGNGMAHGENGGAGGDAGPISINVRNLRLPHVSGSGSSVQAVGGRGGNGGDGVDGPAAGTDYFPREFKACPSICVDDQPTCCYVVWVVAQPGTSSGTPGAGGAGGDISIDAWHEVATGSAKVNSSGGAGGDGGAVGLPGEGHQTCGEMPCTTCKTLQTAGFPADGGAGGDAGALSLAAGQGVSGNGDLQARGGNGGRGSDGVTARALCRNLGSCHGPQVFCASSAARAGGQGGDAGDGGRMSAVIGDIDYGVEDWQVSYDGCPGALGCGGHGGDGLRLAGGGVLSPAASAGANGESGFQQTYPFVELPLLSFDVEFACDETFCSPADGQLQEFTCPVS